MNGPEMRPGGEKRDRADAEQRLTAWMADVAPGRAPDHAIEAGLARAVAGRQAPAWLPKVGPKAASRQGPPTQLFLALGAVGLLALTGGLLAAGGLIRPAPTTDDLRLPTEAPAVVNPAPSATPRPVGAPVEQALATTWIGGTRDIPAIGPSPFRAVVDLTGSVFALFYDSTPGIMYSAASTGNPGEFRLLSAKDEAGCRAGDSGVYRYALDAEATQVTFEPVDDDCAAREALLTGRWQKMAGPDTRLGPLAPGTYATTWFRARADAVGPSPDWNPAYPSITYTVPEGWTNTVDSTSMYELVPADFYAEYGGSPPSDMPWHGIYLRARPVPATTEEGCAPSVPVEGVGSSIDAIAAWLAGHPALRTTEPVARELGGRPAILVDVQLDPAWTGIGTCPNDGGVPVAGLFVSGVGGASDYEWLIYAGERMRLILVDLGAGGALAVVVDASRPGEFDALVAEAMPIVETFRFSDR